MTILIAGGGTGGHLMPALSLAEEIVRQRPDIEPVLVGARRGVDATVLPDRPFRHYLLPFEPLHRRRWWRNVVWLWRLPQVTRDVTRMLEVERPDVVIGTGGYVSGPVLWRAHRLGIPIVLNEQNVAPGVVTRRLASRARQLHLATPEILAHLDPGADTEVFTHGNPVAPSESRLDRQSARTKLRVPEDARVVLVVGGSQGAAAINQATAAALDAGALDGVVVLWGTGSAQHADFERFHAPPARHVIPFWDPIAPAYAAADVAVSRAGAMTIADLEAYRLPAILVPLPTAAADHQTANARALVEAGAGRLVRQQELSGARLAEEVTALLADPAGLARMAASAGSRARPDAVRYIVRDVLRLVPKDPRLS